MDHQPYIPGSKPVEAGPLSRFLPALEEGVIAHWLPLHASTGSWVLDPFGFSPRLALEAARAGFRVLVTANNPITRFLLEIAATPPSESDFSAALAELETSKKGDERLGAHLRSLYLTPCDKCGQEIPAESFLWRRGEAVPYARAYTCPHCGDSGEHIATEQDAERARAIAATDGLHRSRSFERVAKLDDEDRVYAEEAIQHYLPRPLYFLTTVINRVDGLNLTPERRRALTALILIACDAGNTLWDQPPLRPRPKQLNIPNQFREHNLLNQIEHGLSLWMETGAGVACEAWPSRIPDGGGICMYEGRLKELAHEVKKEIPIAAVIGSVPRPNQAFWTLSALWAGWLWGREAVEPYKVALRRRRYDWAWNATALHAAFAHLFELLPLGTPFFGFMPEPEPLFLTSACTAAGAAGFDLKSVALRTEHDPVQILWTRGEHLKRETNEPDVTAVRNAIRSHLIERGEPASYLHVHAAGLTALAESHALKGNSREFDAALRDTNAIIESALSGDEGFVHYSTGESVDTGLWGTNAGTGNSSPHADSLSDRVEVALVTFLQKNPESIYFEIEEDLYRHFPGLLTPSKRMIYEVLESYAKREGAAWTLRAEDAASARRNELTTMTAMIELIGRRLNFSTRTVGKNQVWEENGGTGYVFYVLASALVGRALNETPHPPEKTILVIPGGRASLIAYKEQRDPSLAVRMKTVRLARYRLLRAMLEVPVLTRETFEEQIASDPLEKSKSQMMMF